MDITIQRKWLTPQATCGEMSLNGGSFCFTLEPRKDQSKGKPYSIPIGTYEIKLLKSKRFQMITPHVMNVPGFTEIEIHPGNYPKDTEGCCLVGESHLLDFVGNSRKTFVELMNKLTSQPNDIPITVTYKDPENA